jgi:two-component system, NtrC family, sensor histidine kinase HydH
MGLMSLTETGDAAASFRQQASTFSFLNLVVFGALPLLHVLLSSYLGTLPPVLFAALSLGFLFHMTVFIWLQARPERISEAVIRYLTISSIAVNSSVTFVAATTSKQDSQYFALMIIPILEAAFRFSLPATVFVVAVADSLNFYWVGVNYRVNPPAQFNEYVEAATVALIYTLVGVIAWILVDRLRQKEARLSDNIEELERTRELLLQEEKLAAVGRLSSAIAHEIRNPVAMISSSLSMVSEDGVGDEIRKEMFDIAAKEAKRLEKLTGDFLEYARAQVLQKTGCRVSDTLFYIASACKAYATEMRVRINVEAPPDLMLRMDAGKVQQALLNMVKNGIEASPAGSVIVLRGILVGGKAVRLEVENPGAAIPEQVLEQIFEPFFTTKRGGTGLGLAIARNIARAHGGDLRLLINQHGRVCFVFEVPASANDREFIQEQTWAAS